MATITQTQTQTQTAGVEGKEQTEQQINPSFLTPINQPNVLYRQPIRRSVGQGSNIYTLQQLPINRPTASTGQTSAVPPIVLSWTLRLQNAARSLPTAVQEGVNAAQGPNAAQQAVPTMTRPSAPSSNNVIVQRLFDIMSRAMRGKKTDETTLTRIKNLNAEQLQLVSREFERASTGQPLSAEWAQWAATIQMELEQAFAAWREMQKILSFYQGDQEGLEQYLNRTLIPLVQYNARAVLDEPHLEGKESDNVRTKQSGTSMFYYVLMQLLLQEMNAHGGIYEDVLSGYIADIDSFMLNLNLLTDPRYGLVRLDPTEIKDLETRFASAVREYNQLLISLDNMALQVKGKTQDQVAEILKTQRNTLQASVRKLHGDIFWTDLSALTNVTGEQKANTTTNNRPMTDLQRQQYDQHNADVKRVFVLAQQLYETLDTEQLQSSGNLLNRTQGKTSARLQSLLELIRAKRARELRGRSFRSSYTAQVNSTYRTIEHGLAQLYEQDAVKRRANQMDILFEPDPDAMQLEDQKDELDDTTNDYNDLILVNEEWVQRPLVRRSRISYLFTIARLVEHEYTNTQQTLQTRAFINETLGNSTSNVQMLNAGAELQCLVCGHYRIVHSKYANLYSQVQPANQSQPSGVRIFRCSDNTTVTQSLCGSPDDNSWLNEGIDQVAKWSFYFDWSLHFNDQQMSAMESLIGEEKKMPSDVAKYLDNDLTEESSAARQRNENILSLIPQDQLRHMFQTLLSDREREVLELLYGLGDPPEQLTPAEVKERFAEQRQALFEQRLQEGLPEEKAQAEANARYALLSVGSVRDIMRRAMRKIVEERDRLVAEESKLPPEALADMETKQEGDIDKQEAALRAYYAIELGINEQQRTNEEQKMQENQQVNDVIQRIAQYPSLVQSGRSQETEEQLRQDLAEFRMVLRDEYDYDDDQLDALTEQEYRTAALDMLERLRQEEAENKLMDIEDQQLDIAEETSWDILPQDLAGLPRTRGQERRLLEELRAENSRINATLKRQRTSTSKAPKTVNTVPNAKRQATSSTRSTQQVSTQPPTSQEPASTNNNSNNNNNNSNFVTSSTGRSSAFEQT